MKGTICYTNGATVAVEFDGQPTLRQLQGIVGGNFEPIALKPIGEDAYHMVVNEEGLLIGLPPNAVATEMRRTDPRFTHHEIPLLVGTVLVLEGLMT